MPAANSMTLTCVVYTIQCTMSSQPYHRRQDSAICGSERNHGKQHKPYDTAGETFQKTGSECLPKYLEKDRDVKIRRTLDKLNDDFQTKKKAYQCFPTKK